ncbi:hypothetical protein [Actinomadura fibrosa]|uniref:hypothetical protein n=1 Tax=Actinomadura fibrosa TaxID=111802 RepID=UPI00366DC0E4
MARLPVRAVQAVPTPSAAFTARNAVLASSEPTTLANRALAPIPPSPLWLKATVGVSAHESRAELGRNALAEVAGTAVCIHRGGP